MAKQDIQRTLNTIEGLKLDTAKIIAMALEFLRADIINRSEAAGQRASGKTYSLLRVDGVTGSHGELWGPVHIGVLEEGRQPGRVPYNFAEIIMEWALYKGINIPDPLEFERWAKAVAWNIKLHGSVLYRSGEKKDIFETSIKEFEQYLTEQVKQYYTTVVTNSIRTAWQKGI